MNAVTVHGAWAAPDKPSTLNKPATLHGRQKQDKKSATARLTTNTLVGVRSLLDRTTAMMTIVLPVIPRMDMMSHMIPMKMRSPELYMVPFVAGDSVVISSIPEVVFMNIELMLSSDVAIMSVVGRAAMTKVRVLFAVDRPDAIESEPHAGR